MSALEAVARRIPRWPGLPNDQLAASLRGLLVARLAVIFALLCAVALHQMLASAGLPEEKTLEAYTFLAAAFGAASLLAFFGDYLPANGVNVAFQLLWDAALPSMWLFRSGEAGSLFPLLYLLQILAAALTLYQQGAVVAAILGSIAYGSLLWLSGSPDGFTTWALYSGLFFTLGAAGGYLSDELRRTTESLEARGREMERLMDFHERILRDLPTGLLTVDRDRRIHFLNPAAARILGASEGEAVGRTVEEVSPPLRAFFDRVEVAPTDEAPAGANDVATNAGSPYLVEGGGGKQTVRLQQRVELHLGDVRKILRGDVAELAAEAGLGRLLGSAEAGGRVLIFQDVTSLVHLEEKLRQNEKLAAVGTLAAGIAHEIRNPLAGISGSIEMLRASTPAGGENDENRKLMDIALREIDRLNGLVSEFLNFVRPERIRPSAVDLKQMLEEVVANVLRAPSARNVQIEFRLGEVSASGMEERLRQVAYNLVLNAVQSMPAGGPIEVGCERINAKRVRFWVKDRGVGMTDKVLAHLYEPFFTTKERGTGLGLATVYKIVEAHHGELQVASRPGEGTRFDVVLPAA